MPHPPLPPIDNMSAEHPEELYRAQKTASLIPDLASIGAADIARFHETGYLAIERAFSPEQVETAMSAVHDLVAGDNPEFNSVQYESAASGVDISELNLESRLDLVRKLYDFGRYDARLRAIVDDPALTAVIHTLLGDTPACFQDMALLKSPGGGREKPWHQDHAYFDFPEGTPIVGAWIALDEATLENGCMRIVEGSHREIMPHFNRRDWQICDSHVMGKPVLGVPLPPGGVLLFSGLLMHGTPTNYSQSRRWALQHHYAGKSVEKCDTETRLALFGSEGRDVEC